MSDAQGRQAGGANEIRKTAAAAIGVGELHQLADGRAAIYLGISAAASGERTKWQTDGQWTITKTVGIVLLDGCRAYWDHSANAITFRKANDRDYFVGTIVGDAASVDASCTVNLNVRPVYEVSLRGDDCASQNVWATEATDGLGVALLPGGGVKLAFDAVAEVAQAAIYSTRTFPIASNPILEFRCAVFDKGDDAALDVDIGMASASHATDFEAIAEFVSLHFDGNALDIKAQSDDGTTDVTIVDTTIDAVDDTYFECWMDFRTPGDVQVYINAVLVLSATVFTLGNATGPIFPIVLMEKTSNDTTADFRVSDMMVRTAEQ